MMRVLVALALLAALGCSRTPEVVDQSFGDLLKSVQDAPYAQNQDHFPYSFKLRHQPIWFQARSELSDLKKKDAPVTAAEVESVISNYGGSVAFLMTIDAHPDVPPEQRKATDIVNAHPDLASFSSNLHRLLFKMQDKIYILTPDGTKFPMVHHYLDRNWGIGTANHLLLSFPQVFNDKDLTQAKSFELVVQNLTSTNPELRFAFPVNPVAQGKLSSERLADILNYKEPQTKP